VTYTPLGAGTRIAGGWELSGLVLPFGQNIFIRARGYYGTGVWVCGRRPASQGNMGGGGVHRPGEYVDLT
jgi:hypothetical protein